MIAGGALLGIVLAVLAKLHRRRCRPRAGSCGPETAQGVCRGLWPTILWWNRLSLKSAGSTRSAPPSDPPQAEAGFGQSPMSGGVDEARSELRRSRCR